MEACDLGDAVIWEPDRGVDEKAGDCVEGTALTAATGAQIVAGLGCAGGHGGKGVVVAVAENDSHGGGEGEEEGEGGDEKKNRTHCVYSEVVSKDCGRPDMDLWKH